MGNISYALLFWQIIMLFGFVALVIFIVKSILKLDTKLLIEKN